MTPTQALGRVANLCRELQDEDNEAIIQGRIEALAKELKVDPFQCALVYQSLKLQDGFKKIFGPDVRVKFRAR